MKIKIYPDKSLKLYCQEIKEFNQDLFDELDEMKRLMIEHSGMGLAHNQVYDSGKRVFVMRDLKGNFWEFINPIIIYEDDVVYLDEGCLSFGSIAVQVRRPRVISVKAFKRDGEPFHIIAQDKEAICVAHEIEHLNGQTFLDRLSHQQKRDLLKRMKK